jgi:SAM-dependent methyltransferase
MDRDRLYDDPELAGFYDAENGWGDDLEFCRRLSAGCSSVLDLGCGTGLLAASLAADGAVEAVGVDPAAAMLDIARGRPGGARVRWVQGDARRVRLDRSFDLVVLTGHAFQVFLAPEDRAAVLRTISAHLSPAGRFVFDTRNPAAEEWREWTPAASKRTIAHTGLGPVVAWNDVACDTMTGIVTYETCYRIVADGRVLSARSRIAFPSQPELARLIDEAGLVVDAWLGDWSGAAWSPTAREIIPSGRKA